MQQKTVDVRPEDLGGFFDHVVADRFGISGNWPHEVNFYRDFCASDEIKNFALVIPQ